MSNRLLTYNPETEGAEGGLLIMGVPTRAAQPQPSTELEELELGSAFLEATSTSELASVVNRILRHGALLAGKPIASQVVQHLGARLNRAGQSVRTLLAPPAGRSDTAPSEAMERITGAELEGLSDEDKEFETARAFVRFAMEAGRLAARAPSAQPPAAVATAAARVAARRHAPGLDFVQLVPRFRARRAIRRQSFA